MIRMSRIKGALSRRQIFWESKFGVDIWINRSKENNYIKILVLGEYEAKCWHFKGVMCAVEDLSMTFCKKI